MCCSVLQCVALCCSVVHCVAVSCSELQCADCHDICHRGVQPRKQQAVRSKRDAQLLASYSPLTSPAPIYVWPYSPLTSHPLTYCWSYSPPTSQPPIYLWRCATYTCHIDRTASQASGCAKQEAVQYISTYV